MHPQQLPLLTPLRVIETIHNDVRLPHICLVYKPITQDTRKSNNKSVSQLMENISKVIAQYKLTHWLQICSSIDQIISYIRQLLAILHLQNEQGKKRKQNDNIEPICNIVLCAPAENQPEVTRAIRSMLSHSQNSICVYYFFVTTEPKTQVESLCQKLNQYKQVSQMPKMGLYIINQNKLKQVVRVFWLCEIKNILYQLHICFTSIRAQQYNYPCSIVLPYKSKSKQVSQNFSIVDETKIEDLLKCHKFISEFEPNKLESSANQYARLWKLANASFNSLINAIGLNYNLILNDSDTLDACKIFKNKTLIKFVHNLMTRSTGMETLGHLKALVWSMNQYKKKQQYSKEKDYQTLYCRLGTFNLSQLQSDNQLITLSYLLVSTDDICQGSGLLMIIESQYINEFIIRLQETQQYIIWPLSIFQVDEINLKDQRVRVKYVGHYSNIHEKKSQTNNIIVLNDNAQQIICKNKLKQLLPEFTMDYKVPLMNLCLKVEQHYYNLSRDQQTQCNKYLYQLGQIQQSKKIKMNALYCFKVLHHLSSICYRKTLQQGVNIKTNVMTQQICDYCEICELVAESYADLEQYHKSLQAIQSCILVLSILYDYGNWLNEHIPKQLDNQHKLNKSVMVQLKMLKLYIKYFIKLNNAEISYQLLNPILQIFKKQQHEHKNAFKITSFSIYCDFLFLKSELIKNELIFKKQTYSLQHQDKNQKIQGQQLITDLQANLELHRKHFNGEINLLQSAIILCLFQLYCAFYEFERISQKYQQIMSTMRKSMCKSNTRIIFKLIIECKLTFVKVLERESKFQESILIYQQIRQDLDELAEIVYSNPITEQQQQIQKEWVLNKLKQMYQRFALLFYKLKSYESSFQVFEQYLSECTQDDINVDYQQFIGIKK